MHLEGLNSGDITFSDLVSGGVVEWVDAEEEEDLLIALGRSIYRPSLQSTRGQLILQW